MTKFIRMLSVSALVWMYLVPAMAADDPVAMIIDAKGEVVYSSDGQAWKSVNRNKFLFEGWRVKTGNNGMCKILKHHCETIEVLAGDTEIEMDSSATRVLAGNISDTRPARSFGAFLKRRFASVQKHTVTRAVKSEKEIRLKTAENITISEEYPELAWENPGSEYTYQFFIGDRVFDVPGTDKDIVRFRVPVQIPGENAYCVNVLYKGEVLYAPEDRGTLKCLSDEEKKKFRMELARILEIAPDNRFLLGGFMEENGFKVVAMDHYRDFLHENPEAEEVRPFLVRVLGDLELEKLKKAELERIKNHRN